MADSTKQTDKSAASVPKKNNAPLIVVLLLLIGGGAWFALSKGKKGDPGPDTTPVVATATATEQQPAIAAPPPPPPPPPEETAPEPEATEKKPTGKILSGKGQGACDSPCEGEATAALRAALRQRGGSARGCYDSALRQNAALRGKLTVGVRVSPSGSVCSASVVADSMGSPAVNACVLKRFRGASFPAPTGGCVDAQVPLNFVPQE